MFACWASFNGHAREEQRPFHNTGSFDAYAIEEDTKKDGLITVLIFMS